jgi:hypothetical protein
LTGTEYTLFKSKLSVINANQNAFTLKMISLDLVFGYYHFQREIKMSDGPHGGVYIPIIPIGFGVIVGLTIALISSKFLYSEGINIYHTAGNPGVMIDLVNSGWFGPSCALFGILFGVCFGLVVCLSLYGRI